MRMRLAASALVVCACLGRIVLAGGQTVGATTAALNVNPPGPGGVDSYELAQKGELGSMLNSVGQRLTNPFQPAYEWRGWHARKLMFDLLNESIKDPSITLDFFAYDLDEPDAIKLLEQLGPRLDLPFHRASA